jgi:hypothetical protein
MILNVNAWFSLFHRLKTSLYLLHLFQNEFKTAFNEKQSMGFQAILPEFERY